MKKIKVSFIGAGNMSKEHIKVFENNKNFIIKGIFSRSSNKINKILEKYKNLKKYNSILELYKKTKSDLVVVAVNEEQYIKIIKKIINFPWVCLAEKPLGSNYQEIRSIYNLVKKKKRKIFVSLNRRFYESTINAKKIIKKFVGPKKIEIIDCQNRNEFKKNAKKIGITKSKKTLKYLMYSNSIHLIDYISYFCNGRLIKFSTNKVWQINSPKNFIANMEFSSGDKVRYQAFWQTFKKWEIKLHFNKYKIKIKPLEKIFLNKCFKTIKKINYKNDLNFKPGLFNQSKEIEKFFLKKKHNLVNFSEYMKSVLFVKKIYNV